MKPARAVRPPSSPPRSQRARSASQEHQQTEVVVAHGGGYFPTYMGRLDRNILKPEAVPNIKGKPSDYLRHFHYDTCVYDTLALEMLFRRVGADRIVLGADYPVGDADPVGVVKAAVRLPGHELCMVAAATAAQLLGIKVPAEVD
jgi:aminocarboxymuconate-semialdehyde decarboxylase